MPWEATTPTVPARPPANSPSPLGAAPSSPPLNPTTPPLNPPSPFPLSTFHFQLFRPSSSPALVPETLSAGVTGPLIVLCPTASGLFKKANPFPCEIKPPPAHGNMCLNLFPATSYWLPSYLPSPIIKLLRRPPQPSTSDRTSIPIAALPTSSVKSSNTGRANGRTNPTPPTPTRLENSTSPPTKHTTCSDGTPDGTSRQQLKKQSRGIGKQIPAPPRKNSPLLPNAR